jgi:hypothetical protein
MKNMNQSYIAKQYRLQIGDRLIREKGIFSKHHGIYVGIHNRVPMVAENQNGCGVQYVTLNQFLLGNVSNLARIERFKGTEKAKSNIILRINKLIGRRYDLINFNCEHFAELIQTGKSASKQVNNALLGIGTLVVIGLIASKNIT